MPPPKATLVSIANSLGLSVSGVSKALAGKSDIGPETRKAVLAEAKRQNYVTNLAASSLRSGKSNTLGVVFSTMDDFQPEVIIGIQKVLGPSNYQACILNSQRSVEREVQAITWVASSHLDGLLIQSVMTPEQFKKNCPFLNIPTVFLNRAGKVRRHEGNVALDSSAATTLAVRRLVELGHRRIGLVMRDRYNEAKEKAARAGGKAGTTFKTLPFTSVVPEEIEALMGPQFDRSNKKRCTAFLCSGDMVALFVMAAAAKTGFHCPKDYSLVGFGDLDFVQYMHPSLTTIHQPFRKLGEEAALLWQHMSRTWPETKALDTVRTLTGHFVERDSIAKPPNC